MQLRDQYDEGRQKKLQKYKCCGICFLVTGIILVITCAFTPIAMDTIIGNQAKKSSQLSEANEADWKDIPGSHDIGIYWYMYFYNCTNPEDVTYRNAKPEFTEYGPYTYREYDTYNDLVYQDLQNTLSQDDKLPAVYNKFVQGNNFTSDDVGNIDTPMYLTNQALFGVWYQQNAAQQNDTQWRVYLTLLYSAIQDGLGRQVIEQGAWQQMMQHEFKTADQINQVMVPTYTVTPEQADAMFNDPWYGLKDYNNYGHWQALIYTDDPALKQTQMVWLWEMRSYFGLTFEQVDEFQQNWNLHYNDWVEEVIYSIPAAEPYNNQTGIAYWQWAASWMTENRSDPKEPSVAQSTDTVTGYVEFSYWLEYYCNPENEEGAKMMNAANWAYFGDVKMYRNTSDPTANMEYLFTLVDPIDGKSDPARDSLFNLTSLQALVKTGQETVNIIRNPDLTIIQDFTLGQDWTNLAWRFNLFDEDANDDVGTKRAYLLWLWMTTAWDLTFEQSQNGGNFQIGVIGTLGATAFMTEMNTMSLEFPMLTMASQVNVTAEGVACADFYTTNLDLTSLQATALCTSSTNFTFADPFLTSVALTNAYLYQNTYNSFYFKEFLSVSGVSPVAINQTFYGSDSAWTTYFNSINGDIYTQYKDTACKSDTVMKPVREYCSFSNLTYNQWLDGTILANPLSGGPEGTSDGYVMHYGDHATGWITPEYSYWRMKNDKEALPAGDYQYAIEQTYFAFNISGLYNGKKYQDVLLYPDQIPEAQFPGFDAYLRSIAINFGLSGVLTIRSPREMIEGYTDPLVAELATMPIYMGGDKTTSPVLALVNPPTHPTDNTVAFFTGQEDYTMTRRYGQWLGQEYIKMKGAQYTSITQIEEYTYNPWEELVLLDGTDGMQFSPDLSTDDTIAAFVNDLNRNCYFDYSHSDDTYPGLDQYVFQIQYDLMVNKTANPANENFDVRITGTSNMTTSLNAYGFVSKGHYLQLAEAAESSKPIITDTSGKVIEANTDDDDTYLGVEPLSGVCLTALERIFFNMQLFSDSLFQNTTVPIPADNGYFYPLSYVRRESAWTQDQVDDVFGPLVLANKLKWTFFALMLFFGLVFLALTVLCGLRYRKQKKYMEMVVPPEEGNDTAGSHALLDKGSKGGNTDSDAEFDNDKPDVTQQDRMFNLHGQGKPIAEMNHSSNPGSDMRDY